MKLNEIVKLSCPNSDCKGGCFRRVGNHEIEGRACPVLRGRQCRYFFSRVWPGISEKLKSPAVRNQFSKIYGTLNIQIQDKERV